MPLYFNTLLADEGIAPKDVRLIRHQTEMVKGRPPYVLWRDNPMAFELYQRTQRDNQSKRTTFNVPYWASFVVTPARSTLFIGMFDVRGRQPAPPDLRDPLSGTLLTEKYPDSTYDLYDCQRSPSLSSFAGRLAIEWGSSAISWVQRADRQNKVIVELAREFLEEPFPGFTKIIRSLSDLESMPPAWKEVLRSSRGVYLLACPRTREHYVGSASGEEGFLGRWSAYVRDGHGGNAGMRLRDPTDYVVSILEVVGSNTGRGEIEALESTWKQKLLSRDLGLNRN